MRVPMRVKRTTTEVATSLLLVLTMGLWNAPVLAARPAEATKERFGREGTVKVRVSNPEARLAASRAGWKVAGYGAFEVYEVSRETAAALAREDASTQVLHDENVIELNSGSLDTSTRAVKGRAKVLEADGGSRLHLVQFAGPVRPEWHGELRGTGARIVTYIPNNAYLVWGSADEIGRVRALAEEKAFVQWDGAYDGEMKIPMGLKKAMASPGGLAALAAGGESLYSIQLVEDRGYNTATLGAIQQARQGTYYNEWGFLGYVNVETGLAPESVKAIAARADVVSIQPWAMPKKQDERQNVIMTGQVPVPAGNPNYLTWLAGMGFTQGQFDASNFAVDVSDSGVDNATTSPNHFGLRVAGNPAGTSRIIYNRLEGTPNGGSTLQGCDGHGNINAHIVGGFVPDGSPFTAFPHMDAAGYRYGLGVAPFVRIGSSVVFDPSNFTSPNYPNLQSKAYNDGARISTNSWGANTGGTYTASSQAYDALVRDAQPTGSTFPVAGNQEMVIVFSAGNAGSSASTIGSPASGKNVFTVGAAENEHPFGGADFCGIGDTGANSANDVISFSSRGPCTDGRRKPDIQAPGTHVSGGVFQASNVSPVSGNGVAAACFDADGVCGGPSNNFWPLAQQWYTASSGTSHSAPAVAGATALLRQYFINSALAPPTPAMTKAWLMSSARYMTGVGANDTLPSNSQGMGMVDLERAFGMTTSDTVIRDQEAADLFTASGQERVFFVDVADSGQPFRVTLAWTDAPGPTSGNAYVNNLDLQVTVGGQIYLGNVFSGASSTPGGAADPRNNVESVFLPAGVSGTALVKVIATNIAGDGVPNVGGALDQDFALVVANAVPGVAAPILGASGSSIGAESCDPANGVVDPDETVTVSLCLQNANGAADTANLVATLQATGGVTAPSAPQSYGVVTAGGAAVCRDFTFTASGTCGNDVVATLALQDGAADLGTAAYTFRMGILQTAFAETFDGLTAPALPAGWVAANAAGPAPLWVTTTTNVDSAPNAAFVNNPNVVSDKRLDTPAIPIQTASAQLSFRSAWALESGWDGAVLEISIDGGAFQDILAAGGSFVTGGYNGTVSSSFGNPIGGRQAWTNLSGGTAATPTYITTTVNLPAAAAGLPVVLRFRMGSDTSVARTGWWIDGLSIADGYACCVGCTDTTAPVVTPPADFTLMQSTCDLVAPAPHPPGASSTTSPGLLGFLSLGSAVDPPPCESSASMLPPQVGGLPALGHFFPAGTHTVTFRAEDVAGNVGTATASLTVAAWMDLNDDDAANLVDLVILGGYFTGRVVPGGVGSPWTAPLSRADVSTPAAGVNIIDQVLFQNYLVGNLACLPQ